MRPPLPPGLIVVASFLAFGKLHLTDAVRLKDEPDTAAAAIDAAIAAADHLVKEGLKAGDQVMASLHAILPNEPTPGMVVYGLRADRDIDRRQLTVTVRDAFVQMMGELLDAAARPKAPPRPASLAKVH